MQATEMQTETVMPSAPLPVMFAVAAGPDTYPGYRTTWARVLGLLQIFCGTISIVINIVQVSTLENVGFIGSGIWGGVFFIIAGGLALGSSRTKGKCLIIGCMVMSILACGASIPLLIVPPLAYRSRYAEWSWYNGRSIKSYTMVPPTCIVMSVVAFIEFVAAITQAILTCGVCCLSPQVDDRRFLVMPGANVSMTTPVQPQPDGLQAAAVVAQQQQQHYHHQQQQQLQQQQQQQLQQQQQQQLQQQRMGAGMQKV